MKLIDALRNVDKSKTNAVYVDADLLAEQLGLYDETFDITADFYTRVRSYWITKRYDSDTWVGFRALYFDGLPIGTIVCEGRKNGEDFTFISQDAADKLRATFWPRARQVHVLNPDDEIADTYSVHFASELLVKEGLYRGQPVTVVEKYDHGSSRIRIQDARGYEQGIDASDLQIPLHMEKKS